jgi:hypothetical protein
VSNRLDAKSMLVNVTPEILRAIATLPVDLEPVFRDVPARYEGTRIPLHGLAQIDARVASLRARVVDTGDWAMAMLTSAKPGYIGEVGSFFRDVAPSYLLGPNARGRVIADDGSWTAVDARYEGEGPDPELRGQEYRFKVGTLVLGGPAKGRPVAVTRVHFAGSEFEAISRFAGRTLICSSVTNNAARTEDEVTSATIDGTLDQTEQLALWLLLSLVTGNRVHSMAIEHFDQSGLRIDTEHRRGVGVSVGRHEPFHRFEAPLAARGLERLGDGILRLMRAPSPFPIEIVVHHLLDANTGYIETDAAHLTFGIHTAFEAWNRKYGKQQWIGNSWKKIAERIRSRIAPETIEAIPAAARDGVMENLRTGINTANRTSMGWRQRLMFKALQIDVSDEDNGRALNLRNELLHNGFLLKRWRDLTPEERQRRRDDVERLRRLLLLIIFRLTAYEGPFLNPVRLTSENVTSVPLPPDIAAQQDEGQA